MPNPSYLDEIYGLMPYGSPANPMNMEAMDVRPEAVRLEDEIQAERAAQHIEPPLGSDYPEGSRVDLGDGTERVYGPNGSFEVRDVPAGVVNFGDMTPRAPMGPPAAEKKGNVEYSYGTPEPTKVNRARSIPRAAPASGSIAKAAQASGSIARAEPESVSVDAVSGAGGPPSGPEAPTGPWSEFLEGPQKGRAAPGDTRASIMNEAETSPVPEDLSQIYEREFSRQANLTPEQRVAENARREFERQQQGVDELAAATAKARVEAQQNLDAMLSARKKSQEEIDKLKAQPGWWDRRSTGQKVLLYADAAFSGMLAAFQGSNRNTAIESMQSAIEQDAEERAAEYAQARQGAADADELYKVKELVRLRGFEEAKQMVLSRMAQYDKNGSMAAAGMAAVQDLEARQAEAEMRVLEHNWKKELELRKMVSDELQTSARLKQSDVESRRAAGTARRGQDLQYQASLLSQASGKEAADLENTQARTAAVQAELERHNRADVIVDPGNLNFKRQATRLGRPRDFDQKKDIQAGVNAYSKVREQLKDLIAYTKAHGNEAGAGTEARKVIDQKRKLIAQTYAKIVDSVGAVSDKTIEAAEDVIPDTTGWIGGTLKDLSYTDEVYKSLVRNADVGIEAMATAGIEGYTHGTLSRQWTDFDTQMFAPAPTEEDLALERAREFSPGSFVGGKYKEAAEEGARERGGDAPVYAPVDEPDLPKWGDY